MCTWKICGCIVFAILAATSLPAGRASATPVEIAWSNVADEGNAPNDLGFGAVGYKYAISTYEVTNAQYATFLNAVAKADPKGLYNTNMAGTVNASNPLGVGGIVRTGSSGSYVYSFKTGCEELPVNFVSYYDSLRFVNWMANGQPVGAAGNTTTEKGVYDMTVTTPTKASGATVWLPSEDEWVKAAYYKGGSTSAGYWDFATRSNSAPANPAPAGTANSANYLINDYAVGGPKYLSDVGAYTVARSAYGVADMNGNVWEWNDSLYQGNSAKRVYRGGGFDSAGGQLASVYQVGADKSSYESYNLGFRIAGSYVPEPASMAILALCGIPVLRRRRYSRDR